MKTIKFEQEDPRLMLFSNMQSFIVGTDIQHIDTNGSFAFAGQTIKPGVVFNSLGKNVLHEGYSYLESKAGNYYQFKGCIDEVVLPGFLEPTMLVLFTAFSITGTNEGMVRFAQSSGCRNAYFALAYNSKSKQLEFIDSEHTKKVYAGHISIEDQSGHFLLIDEI